MFVAVAANDSCSRARGHWPLRMGRQSEKFSIQVLRLLGFTEIIGRFGFQIVDIESTTYQRPPEALSLCLAHRLVPLVTEVQHPLQVMLVNAIRCCRSTISIPPTIAIAPTMPLVSQGLQNFLSPKRANRSCKVIACEGSMY